MLPFPELDFRRTPATLIIAGVAVALELVCLMDESRRLFYYNESLGILPYIWTGEIWRPFTTTLLHGGLFHAAFNVYWLLRFGSALEARLGSYAYLGLVVLLAYTSMLPQYIVTTYDAPPTMIVGLSGVIYGLLGMLIVGRRRHPDLAAVCDPATIQFLLFWLVLCVGLTYANMLPVANVAHAGGLLFGWLYGQAIFGASRRTGWTALASAATILVLATLIACPGHAGYEKVRRNQQILKQLREIPAAGQRDEERE